MELSSNKTFNRNSLFSAIAVIAIAVVVLPFQNCSKGYVNNDSNSGGATDGTPATPLRSQACCACAGVETLNAMLSAIAEPLKRILVFIDHPL